MSRSDTCALSCYQQIATIDREHDIRLVQHRETLQVYVRKHLTVYNADVFRYLMEHHIKGTPCIIELVEQDEELTVIEEYISGQTLRAILDNGNLFTAQDAAALIRQLCGILRELHNAPVPIVHRDIKPSNILLTADGEVRLLDMNAAKWMDSAKSEDTHLIGTVGYAAPEQYGFGSSGIQTDVYSVGVLLNELVTGSLPKDRLPPGNLGEIVRKCTRIDPKNRYRDIPELLHALNTYDGGPPEAGKKFSPFHRYLPPGFRSGTTVNILTALGGYALLIYLSLTFTASGVLPGLMTVIERILLFIFGLGLILFTCNYLDVWDACRISRIKNTWLRTAAVLAVDLVLAFAGLIVMIIVVMSMGGK